MELSLIVIFVVGYFFIAFEHSFGINKAATALTVGVLCWVVCATYSVDHDGITHALMEHLSEIAGILFFLLGAMTIVEIIDLHDGFQFITDQIKTTNVRRLLWILACVTFLLSGILDNLTTTIVIVSLLRKLINDREQRLFFTGITVIAANAGGAWSPMGDVTTTMLWIGGQVTPIKMMSSLILPSVVCLLVPLIFTTFQLSGDVQSPEKQQSTIITTKNERLLIFCLGLGSLLFVPVFKTVTHLPPFMAILFGLGVLWIATEMIHKGKKNEDRDFLSAVYALRKSDTPSILFFLGILLSIAALETAGVLGNVAAWLDQTIKNESMIVLSIGLLSAIVDNVPLVAAAQGMYSMETYPTDHYFWEFLAYASGTGGSILIIGSAAGVAAMGMEQIDFMWYLRRISFLALLGFFAGAFVYIALH
jgi:Na+/H+ antiporter NhaD/arsenite permease-like protein